MSQALDEIKIGGLGASRKRVEDNRFIRGRGNYTDEIVLPGMLHMEILRSPLAHARIVSIDTSRAWQIPGVHLVLTGEMMATRNLAWMPTLSYDTQAVLATDKVRFQGQEVACVIADDPYIAKDACEAIDVEYEPLPPIVNPEQAVAEGAPVIRDDKENQADNVIYRWEVGDAAASLERRRVRTRVVRVEADDSVGLGEGLVGRRLVARLPLVAGVVGLALLVVADDGGVGGQRELRVDDGWERVVLDVDELERVPRDVRALGHHAGDLLALEPHLVGGEHGLRVTRQCGHPGESVRGERLAGHDSDDAGERLGGRCVDVHDAGVRELAAQEREVQHPGEGDVLDVLAAALDEAVVLFALHAVADAPDLGGGRARCVLLGRRHRVASPRSVAGAVRPPVMRSRPAVPWRPTGSP